MIVWLLFLTAPCYSAEVDIKDSHALIPTVRVIYSLRRSEDALESLAIDMEISKARGSSSQYLASGDYIQHKNVLIYGPATVDTFYNATFAALGLRGGWLRGKSDIEWIAGLDLLHCDVQVRSGVRSPSERIYDYGFVAGGQFTFKPREKVRLYGKGIVSTDLTEYGYRLLSGELAVAVNPEPNLALFAGWRWLNFDYTRQLKSNINVSISGPTAGGELAF